MSEQVQFVTDGAGVRKAVLMDIAEYETLMEDLEDLAAIADRRKEPTIPHEEFVNGLRRDGVLQD